MTWMFVKRARLAAAGFFVLAGLPPAHAVNMRVESVDFTKKSIKSMIPVGSTRKPNRKSKHRVSTVRKFGPLRQKGVGLP
jgi:hypothetical protein